MLLKFLLRAGILIQKSFQFRFLIQCQRYIGSMPKDDEAKHQIQDRIHSVCKDHLDWVFHIGHTVDSAGTWSPYYAISVSDNAEELKASSGNSSLAHSVEGAFQFLKAFLYLSMWNEEWQFVLELLNLELDNWLSYLASNKHMASLWVEDEDVVSFNPYDSTSEDVSYILRTYPHYHLSDAALVCLALLYIEKMIQFIEDRFHTQILQDAEFTERKVKYVRNSFAVHQGSLSLQNIQSSILKTFKVPKDRLPSGVPALAGSQSTEARSFERSETLKKRDEQIIVFQRVVNQCVLEIEPTDFATIEASILGIFEGPQGHVDAAWRETLKLQKEKDISTIQDPRQIALTMFASKLNCVLASSDAGKIEQVSKNMLQNALYDSGSFAQTIVEDALEPISYRKATTYETVSLLVGSLFKECREIL